MRRHRGRQSVLNAGLRRESPAQEATGFEESLAAFDIYGLRQKETRRNRLVANQVDLD